MTSSIRTDSQQTTVLQSYDPKNLPDTEERLYDESHLLWDAYSQAKAAGLLNSPEDTFSFSHPRWDKDVIFFGADPTAGKPRRYPIEEFTCTAEDPSYSQEAVYRGLDMTTGGAPANRLLNYQEFACTSRFTFKSVTGAEVVPAQPSDTASTNFLIGNFDVIANIPLNVDSGAVFSVTRKKP